MPLGRVENPSMARNSQYVRTTTDLLLRRPIVAQNESAAQVVVTGVKSVMDVCVWSATLLWQCASRERQL